MNKIFATILLSFLPWAAFAWVPPMSFQVTPQYAQVQVSNPSPYNTFCQGYVYGVTQAGFSVNSWFSSYLPAYGYQFAYVYAYAPYYFVNAWAQIQCQ
jgi:hypothetical protein